MKFITYHMWDPDQRVIDPAHGMLDDIAETSGIRRSSRSKDPASLTAPCVRIALGRTKITTAGQGAFAFAAGRAAIAIHEWMQAANITSGPNFRQVCKDGSIGANSLTPQSVNLILKKRCRIAGLDPADFSAHGLRSGFMIQAGRDASIHS